MGQHPVKPRGSVRVFKQVKANIVVIGVRKAGMSSIMDRVIPGNICDSSCAGNALATLTPCKGVNLITWGIGFGHQKPPLWRYHIQNADGMILIVDSGNQRTLVTMKEELQAMFKAEMGVATELPVIVMANKADLANARSAADIADALKLYEHSITWNVQCCSAVTGEGLTEGFRKLMELIRMRKKGSPSLKPKRQFSAATM